MDSFEKINLADWQQVGEGGNGKTYVNPAAPGEILKVNNARLSTLEAVRHEYDISKAVAGLGISVPEMYRIVHVGDVYGTVSQLIIGKKSLSRICQENPERTEEMARLLCQKGKELSATPCNTVFFPSRKQQALLAIEKATYVSKKNKKTIRAFIETIPESTGCSHGDFQTGNLIQAGENYYWIDLDRFAYGDPMFDIGHLFLICHLYAPMKRVQDIFHMTQEQLYRFWDAFAREYTGQEDHAAFDRVCGKFACMDIILRNHFVKATFAEKIFFGIYVRRLVKEYFDGE